MRENSLSTSRWFLLLNLLLATLIAVPDASAQRRRSNTPVKKPVPKVEPYKPVELPDVKKVDPALENKVKFLASEIDRLVEKNYQKHNVTPNPMTSDEQFLRRIYLDITGTIPTMKQARMFLRSNSSTKRARLIDSLLNDYGYVSHNYNYWGDILRVQSKPENNLPGEMYMQYLKESLQQNTPYDKWVHEMLTAKGKPWEEPATGYLFRDATMPMDGLANTVRIFLGTRIACAQCHDHPFDHWTQREFYQLAAMLYPTMVIGSVESLSVNGKNQYNILNQEVRTFEPKVRSGFYRILRPNRYVLWDKENRKLKYPHDYAYTDAKPGELVKGKVLFGTTPSSSSGKTSRQEFAEWLTAKDNPRFTKTIANRLWKKVMGVGLIEPVDDLRDDTVAENPELMTLLTEAMIMFNYDIKEFQRVLFNTQTYQREASRKKMALGGEYHFPGPILRRMTAEQAWDSFLQIAVVDPNGYRALDAKKLGEIYDLNLKKTNLEEIKKRADEYQEFTRGEERKEHDKKFRYKGVTLARASELPIPAPAGHFLNQFGQGDRELIEGGNEDGSMTQILTMFNGPITHMLLEKGSTIYNNVVAEDSETDRVTAIFLTILSREPTATERRIAIGEIRKEGPAGYGNVIWALVNTREFLFIQ